MSSPSRSPSLVSTNSSILATSDEDFKLDPAPVHLIAPAERMIPFGPVDGSLSCLETDKAVEEWAEFKAWKQQRGDLQATNTESPSAPRCEHERFFLPAQHIFFLVSNTVYSVPRAPFEWHSSAFTGKGLSRDDPLILEDITVSHFDNFLSILYPYAYGVYTASTVEEWTAILHLANKWRFESIRTLAITHLLPIATDVEKIILGRQYEIHEWLGDAYFTLCMRDQSLTKEEGRRMQVDDIIEISAIRHQFRRGVQPSTAPPLLIADVCARFGLTAPCAAVSPPPSMESAESNPVYHVHVDGGLDGSNLTPLTHGMGTSAAAEELMVVAEELNSEARVKAAAKIKRAQRAKEKELIDHAVDAYYSSPAYRNLPINDRYRNVAYEAIKEIKKEEYKQTVRDFIATYISENSQSTSL
ncbi:hypothetical protein FIBSPDRAFT_1035820 [Athelia psychrophila]|uniref:BTB domain-containing protein n=1 Tax=Athelia psychrophila TaxID=1759441 RepID=A0A166WKC3_9AGAM|nr:hypothetical protein FIBSPDRAFT_1035820 [Fibularhizoctonia sp. CBS 109695]